MKPRIQCTFWDHVFFYQNLYPPGNGRYAYCSRENETGSKNDALVNLLDAREDNSIVNFCDYNTFEYLYSEDTRDR